ncbi:hypothetical protein PGB90_010023 [Kerria lacca]
MRKLFLSGIPVILFKQLSKVNRSNELKSLNSSVCFNKKALLCSVVAENIPEKKINFKFDTKPFLKKYPQANKILNVFQNFNFNEHFIVQIIEEKPEIIHFDPAIVVSNIKDLMNLGFETRSVLEMIKKFPHLLEFESNEIINTFETWRSCGLHERFLRDFFREHPLLFTANNEEVKIRIKRIRYFMIEKINRITSIIFNNPSIMYGNWNDVEERFAYLYSTMRVLEKDISQSSALSLPLAHIKLRYNFLEKCGVYVTPRKKEEKGFILHKNPPLSEIVDTSDDVFAINVAKVSPEEFQVFKKLVRYEEKVESEDLDDACTSEFNIA